MRIANAEGGLRARLESGSHLLDGSGVDELSTAMIDWYVATRISDAADLAEDGDMLLFQWGTYDWGQGRHFEVSLTRQMSTAELDPEIVQLVMRFEYPPTQLTDGLDSGQRWCGSPGEVEGLRGYIREHDAVSAVRGLSPTRVVLEAESAE